MDNVRNKDDINAILEQLENYEFEQDSNYAYEAIMGLDLNEKQKKIDSLQAENKASKLKIDKLETNIKEMRIKNRRLMLEQKVNNNVENNSCSFSNKMRSFAKEYKYIASTPKQQIKQ